MIPLPRKGGGARRRFFCFTFSVLLAVLLAGGIYPTGAASIYSAKPEDPRAVYLLPSGTDDDSARLQAAIDRVQEDHGQGIVLIGPGRYRLRDTVYVWPAVRLIGYGAERPLFVLPAQTPGFGDPSREKILFFFAGRRPRNFTAGQSVPDANPGTFYSALANVDLQVEPGNPGAVGIRSHYAQHCFLAHMDFQLGDALAGIHEGGNVVEDVHFHGGRHAVWTSKPSPGWQFTLIDCSFAGQEQSAILEREAGLTLIRPHFRHVPTAVEIESDQVDELWVKDAHLEDVSGPAFLFGREKSPRNEINMESVVCGNVPVFAAMRDSGRRFSAPGERYRVRTFSHGLAFLDPGARGRIETEFDAERLQQLPAAAPSDLAPLPGFDAWVNVQSLGARGDGVTDDTEVLQNALAAHRVLYFPSGFYVVRDTLRLRPDSVLIGLHPGATQILLPDNTPSYQGVGAPKPLIEAPAGGSNIVAGIGLYTGGNNRRAVAALWKAGAHSLMNDVRFLGGHGTPLPDGTRENPYNANHNGDPDSNRHWDSQYPSLWVTAGGGGTFLDLWTPSTFAQAGMLVSDTDTEGRAYQISSEHHVRNEVQIRHAAHWSFYALQTEEERGESGFALPVDIEDSSDITLANFHAYRVISSIQPFHRAIQVTRSRDIRFRNVHCDSNSKVSFDTTVYDPAHGVELRDHEFCRLDISGSTPEPAPSHLSVLAPGAKVEKLAGGFFNISGGATDLAGDFYFVDAHTQRIYRWSDKSRELSTISDAPLEPVNVAPDRSGGLMVISYAGRGTVYALSNNVVVPLKPLPLPSGAPGTLYLPASDWSLNRTALSHPTAEFRSPDGSLRLPVSDSFLNGQTSWGVKSSPQIRSFGLSPAVPGRPFYVSDESELRTWKAEVNPDGSLDHFELFAENGGEYVAVDKAGNVYLAAGQIYIFDPSARPLGVIEVPERPIQLAFGGSDGKTLFIAARTSLYSVRLK